MKEDLIIVGAGGFGRVVLEHAIKKYNCYFIDDNFNIGDKVNDCLVIGNINDIINKKNKINNIVIAIGNNIVRKKIYNSLKEMEYIFPNIIVESVYISPYAKIGEGCVFLNNVVIQNGSSVGNGVILNPGVEIHHDSFIDDLSCIYTNSVIRTYAKIGKCVKIDSNITIKNNEIIKDFEEIIYK